MRTMTIRKLNDYRHAGLIDVERVYPDEILTKVAMDLYVETDPLTIYVDDDGLYYVRGAVDIDELTREKLNAVFEELAEELAEDEN